MNKIQKKRLIFILISASALVAAIACGGIAPRVSIALYIASYLIVGAAVLKSAVMDLFHLQPLNENFLMAIATIGAALLGEYSEAVAVMLFYSVGTFFEEIAVEKSRKSVAGLMDIRPDYATLYTRNPDGSTCEERKNPEEISIGELIIIRPGELIPLDGTIMHGSTSLDMSPLTGESLPLDMGEGDSVISGSVNISGAIIVKTASDFEQSTIAKILDLVENAAIRKGKIERFITRFAKIYTPIVVASAALISILPPLVFPGQNFGDWFYRALIFLVVSCPCALVISVPLSFFAGIGRASALGILIKGGNYLEALARMDTVVFDKTGTLTTGVFAVSEVRISGSDFARKIAPEENDLIALMAGVERYSNHPLAEAIVENAKMAGADLPDVKSAEEIAGYGLYGETDELKIIAGNARFMQSENVNDFDAESDVFKKNSATFVHLGIAVKSGMTKDELTENPRYEYIGSIALSDTIKPDAASAISELRARGIRRTVMLTGDRREIAEEVADALGITDCSAELLPGDKVRNIETLLESCGKRGALAFVGDGINDAPALALADIGIAMGGAGSDAAIEAADVVIMNDELHKISVAKRLAIKTVRAATQNVVFALSVKAVVLALAAIGYADMWLAIFADVGVAVLAILNSMRLLIIRPDSNSVK